MPLFLAFCIVVELVDKRAVASYADNIIVRTCWFESGAHWPRSLCGILQVPEDYSKPDGRIIELPFIIFKAYARNANTYPLVVAGGGGLAAHSVLDRRPGKMPIIRYGKAGLNRLLIPVVT